MVAFETFVLENCTAEYQPPRIDDDEIIVIMRRTEIRNWASSLPDAVRYANSVYPFRMQQEAAARSKLDSALEQLKEEARKLHFD